MDRVTADVRSAAELAAALEGVDVVVHSAGLTRAKADAEYHRVNAEGTEALALKALEAGVRRFVLVSSLAARGPDQGGGSSAGTAGDRPTSSYGESKLAGERRLFQVVAQSSRSMHPVILRPGAIYGPRDEESLSLFRMARSGLLPVPASRGQLQPVFVKDVADAVVRATARPGVELGPYPIAGPQIITWEQLGDALAAAIGKTVRLLRLPTPVWQVGGAVSEAAARVIGLPPQFDRRTADDLARFHWTADLGDAETGLGWRPETSVGEAMSLTADWYRAQGWLKS